MKVTFHRKTFVILGQLDSMGKHEAWSKIEELGGYTSSTPRPSSDYIVIGKRPGKKLALVEKVGKPTLTEEEFLAAIKATETGREDGQEDVGFDDALANIRELLSEAPNREHWGKLQELLDHCTTDELEATVDYVEQHIAAWPNGDDDPGAPLPLAYEATPSELRTFSVAWRNMALAGERSPLLRLGRSLDLGQIELRDEAALHITNHPDLVNVRSLTFGTKSFLDAAFYKALLSSKHLPALTSITFRWLTTALAKALCSTCELENLRYVTLAPLTQQSYAGESAEIFAQLFQADWWEQIEGLACCTAGTYGYYHFHRTCYPALASQAHRMTSLRHLVLEDTRSIDDLLDADLLLRLTRLTMGLCDEEMPVKVLDYLSSKDHNIEVLDLSRGIFLSSYYRPKKHAKPPQKVAVERLMQSDDWGPLREVVVEASLLGVRLKKKLDKWGEGAGITVTSSPWTA